MGAAYFEIRRAIQAGHAGKRIKQNGVTFLAVLPETRQVRLPLELEWTTTAPAFPWSGRRRRRRSRRVRITFLIGAPLVERGDDDDDGRRRGRVRSASFLGASR